MLQESPNGERFGCGFQSHIYHWTFRLLNDSQFITVIWDIWDMLDIANLCLALKDEYGLTDADLMRIAGIKDKSTITRWFTKNKASAEAHRRLWIHFETLQPITYFCPYDVPTKEMVRHALERGIKRMEKDAEVNAYYWKMKHEYERLIRYKHYWELGWTDKKHPFQIHHEMEDEFKVDVVATYHDDARIREHFLKLPI